MNKNEKNKLSNKLCTLLDEEEKGETRIEKARNLIQCGADVNHCKDAWMFNTPLHFAVFQNDVKLFQLLLENGAFKSLKESNDEGTTPDDIAKRLNNPEILNLIIQFANDDGENQASSSSKMKISLVNNLTLGNESRLYEIWKTGTLPEFHVFLKENINESTIAQFYKIKDIRGFNCLMIAAEYGNTEIVQILVESMCIDVNELTNNHQNASDLAFNNGKYKTVLVLLEADSQFPKNFDIKKIDESSEIGQKIKNFINERKKFHESIKSGKLEDIKLIMKNSHLKIGFDLKNNSALRIAFENRAIDIIAYLRSRCFAFANNENSDFFENKLDEEQKEMLRKANLEYFQQSENVSITKLISCSKISFNSIGNEENFKKIRQFFEELNNINEIQPILKTVANAKHVEIIFDFNEKSVDKMDPRADRHSLGKVYPLEQSVQIYIGGNRDLSDILETLAHELCHYAMQLLYENSCKPYYNDDNEREKEFRSIFEKYKDNKIRPKDEIVDEVYVAYQKDGIDVQLAELIVRIPHMIAKYHKQTSKLDECKKNFPELFDFYYNNTLIDLMKCYASLSENTEVKDFNALMGEYEKSKEVRMNCIKKKIMPQINCKGQLIIKSNVPQLVLKMYREQLEIEFKTKATSLNIFLTFEQILDIKYKEKIKHLIELKTRPRFFVIQETFEVDFKFIDCSIFGQLAKSGRNVVYILHKNFHTEKYFFADIKTRFEDIDFTWQHLTLESQSEMLERKVEFRGKEVSWNQLLDVQSLMLQEMPLDEILNETKLFNDLKELEINSNLMTSIYIQRSFEDKTTKSETSDNVNRHTDNFQNILNQNQLLELANERKIIIISDIAGSGKTTFLKHIRSEFERKYPHHLIVLIDLKQYAQTLNVNSNQDISFNVRLENILNINKTFDQKVFRQFLIDEKVILLLDGFDEINGQQRNDIVNILKSFVENQKIQILIASRPHCIEELKLGIENHKLIKMLPLTIENQIYYLTQFWKSQNLDCDKVKKSAEIFVNQFRITTNYDELVSFIGNALQLRMAAQVFNPNYLNVEETLRSLTLEDGSINLYEFYDYFKNQLTITWNDKFKIATNQNIDPAERLKSLLRLHQKQALKLIVKDDLLLNKINNIFFTQCHSLSDEMIAAFGVVTKNSLSDEFEFCHRTFAEFFVANFLVTEFMGKKNSNESWNIICELVAYLANQTDLTKTFLNYAMYNENLNNLLNSKQVLENLNSHFKIKMHSDKNLLLQILRNDDSKLMSLIIELKIPSKESIQDNLDSIMINGYKKSLWVLLSYLVKNFNETDQKKILQTTICHLRRRRRTVLFYGIGHLDIGHFKKLLQVYKNVFGIKYLVNIRTDAKMPFLDLYFKDTCGNLSLDLKKYLKKVGQENKLHLLDYAARSRSVQNFDEVFKIFRENLSLDELEKAIKENNFEFSVLTEASRRDAPEISRSFIAKLKELFPAKEKLKTFFMFEEDRSRLHRIFKATNDETFDLIWNFFCELFDEPERKNEILKRETLQKWNILNSVVQNKNPEMVRKLLKLISGLIGEEELKKMVFEQDLSGNTFMHSFVLIFYPHSEDVFEVLITELKLNEQLNFFAIRNNENQTCFDFLSNTVRIRILPQAQKFLSSEEFKLFLLFEDKNESNILHTAAQRESDKDFEIVWQAFREVFNDEEMREFFQKTSKRYILAIAAGNCKSPNHFKICITAAKSLFTDQQFKSLCSDIDLIQILKKVKNIAQLKLFQKITIDENRMELG